MKNFPYISISLVLTACIGTTQPAKFYTLSVGKDLSGQQQKQNVSIGLGPISLPALIERPQMILRTSDTEVTLDEFHRWGESLNDNLSDVMVRNLMKFLHTDFVIAHPWPSYRKVDYQVVIDIFQFDAHTTDGIFLDGTFSIINVKQNKELSVKPFSIRETPISSNFEDIARAYSKAAIQLSYLVVEAINVVK